MDRKAIEQESAQEEAMRLKLPENQGKTKLQVQIQLVKEMYSLMSWVCMDPVKIHELEYFSEKTLVEVEKMHRYMKEPSCVDDETRSEK